MELTCIGIVALILFGIVLHFARMTLKDIMQGNNEQSKEDEM